MVGSPAPTPLCCPSNELMSSPGSSWAISPRTPTPEVVSEFRLLEWLFPPEEPVPAGAWVLPLGPATRDNLLCSRLLSLLEHSLRLRGGTGDAVMATGPCLLPLWVGGKGSLRVCGERAWPEVGRTLLFAERLGLQSLIVLPLLVGSEG